jgi:putative iron-dependent peroxidase
MTVDAARAQPGILAPVPAGARYLTFTLAAGADPRPALARLRAVADGDAVVVGIGRTTAVAIGRTIPGLAELAAHRGHGVEVPVTPAALWVWVRGADRGTLVHRSRAVVLAVAPAFQPVATIDAFMHDTGRDLTGYEDGTENPQGDDALAAALVDGAGPGLDGASFVAVQQWVHDFDRFDRMTPVARDHAIGRRRSDNAELEDAPESAHVKRTAQEDFAPEAFVLRRSMPWADAQRAGLVFVAFGRSLSAFEAQMRRMAGGDDGITDALFGFTRPVTGAAFWCPPMRAGALDLSALGID